MIKTNVQSRIQENEVPTIQRWWQRNRVQTPVADESMTDTSFGNDTDINKIVERFSRTGSLPEGPSQQPYYGDVTHLQDDLTSLLERTAQAREVLNELEQKANAAKEEQAAKDAAELEAFRKFKAQQGNLDLDGAEAPSAGTPPPAEPS